jgi:hypothetical protein
VSLGNSKLEISLLGGHTPQAGDTLTIVSAAKVTGTFSQGARITVRSGNHNYVFTITYNATSVVLTYVSHPPVRAAAAAAGVHGEGDRPAGAERDHFRDAHLRWAIDSLHTGHGSSGE